MIAFDAIERAKGMEFFCGDDNTFSFCEWQSWKDACWNAGRIIPPEEFKKAHRNPLDVANR